MIKTPTTLAVVAMLCLAGCAGQPTVRTISVAVPVACVEPTPDRPAMPTEAPSQPFTLDGHVAGLQAEIELREGYEVQLRQALAVCTAPVN